MALLAGFGLYVAVAAAFYGYIVKTAAPEKPAPVVRGLRWRRPQGRISERVRRVHWHPL